MSGVSNSAEAPVPPREDVTVMIPAAGAGERLSLGPKALLQLRGDPLVRWVAGKALQVATDVVIAVPPGMLPEFNRLCPDCRCIEGGPTRQDSVARLAGAGVREWVVLADVARPFASTALFRAVLAAARETGVAGAFLAPDVPIAQIDGQRVVRDFRRNEVGLFQAPQAFSGALLQTVLAQAARASWTEQSTLQLFLRAGMQVATVPGEKANIKLTTREDWALAQCLTDYLF